MTSQSKETQSQRELREHQAHIWRRRNTAAPNYPTDAEKLAWREKTAKLKLRIRTEK